MTNNSQICPGAPKKIRPPNPRLNDTINQSVVRRLFTEASPNPNGTDTLGYFSQREESSTGFVRKPIPIDS